MVFLLVKAAMAYQWVVWTLAGVCLITQIFSQVLTPPYFNLAENRRITASSTCGVDVDEPELFCKLVGANSDKSAHFNVIQGQVCIFKIYNFFRVSFLSHLDEISYILKRVYIMCCLLNLFTKFWIFHAHYLLTLFHYYIDEFFNCDFISFLFYWISF